jgi:50S ribosomal subunit-associated GTPase HflX
MRVLVELGADAKRMITVLNKVDPVKDEATLHTLRLHFPEGLCFGALRDGLKELLIGWRIF